DDIDGDDDVRLAAKQVERHRVVDAAVDIGAAIERYRREHRRYRSGGGQRRMQVAFGEHLHVMPEIVRSRHLQRDGEFAEIFRDMMRQEGVQDALYAELSDAQSADRTRAPHAAEHLGATRQYRAGMVLDVLARHAGGDAGSHDRSDRRSGDGHWSDTELVQRLDDVDMG